MSKEPKKQVDFEDVKWGSFQKQFNAYLKQYPKTLSTTLDSFADNILQNPTHYQENTYKRAQVYKSQIELKGGMMNPFDNSGKLLTLTENPINAITALRPSRYMLTIPSIAPQTFNI
jgi:hypothetical protein